MMDLDYVGPTEPPEPDYSEWRRCTDCGKFVRVTGKYLGVGVDGDAMVEPVKQPCKWCVSKEANR